MSANFGWFEIMDRLSVIQQQIHECVYEHQEADVELRRVLYEAQEALGQAYQYAGEKFNDSCEDTKISI